MKVALLKQRGRGERERAMKPQQRTKTTHKMSAEQQFTPENFIQKFEDATNSEDSVGANSDRDAAEIPKEGLLILGGFGFAGLVVLGIVKALKASESPKYLSYKQ